MVEPRIAPYSIVWCMIKYKVSYIDGYNIGEYTNCVVLYRTILYNTVSWPPFESLLSPLEWPRTQIEEL